MGCDVGVWSADQSVLNSPFLDERCMVTRLAGTFPEAIASFGQPDIVHDNGIWLQHNHHIARFCGRNKVSRVVSSRGMLEPWARTHKRFKKQIAWRLYQRRDLFSADAIHVTSLAEAQTVTKLGLRSHWVIPNGISFPPAQQQRHSIPETEHHSDEDRERTALFLGRLYPVKGLPMLLESWAKIRPRKWQLRIVGPDEAGHRAELNESIARHRLGDVVQILGPVDDEGKWREMSNADLFVCPSYTENFGIAIAEAMACGVPVLTTTGTPWEILNRDSLGWWVPAQTEAICKALVEATQKAQSKLRGMGFRSRLYVNDNFQWSRIGESMYSKYLELLDARNKN
ncbi:glycosyl transferase, group 1 [Rhodopirellula europaea SH398]|uniref:Glycosyl transferase, group 1 n=2 Tax=Rhodopirellula TaxID=265488 RepID=M5SAQ8_9BACT|nr:glycosyl transferase, group 1 [Rhodopirellula europaea SH398]